MDESVSSVVAPGHGGQDELEHRAVGPVGVAHSLPSGAPMIERQIERPMPMPWDLVVKSGLKIRSMSFGSTPIPVSSTATMTPPES
jgi:hypothetical protein